MFVNSLNSPLWVMMVILLAGYPQTPSYSADLAPLTAVPMFDVKHYMGHWYEIAKYPNRFQANCIGYTSADYALRADGKITVLNRCVMADGHTNEAKALGRSKGAPDSAMFEVRFAPAWLGWLPSVWADYWVIDIDPDYTLAAVSEPSRTYLWILSRTPTVDRNAYQALIGRLHAKGFDTGLLERTPQK